MHRALKTTYKTTTIASIFIRHFSQYIFTKHRHIHKSRDLDHCRLLAAVTGQTTAVTMDLCGQMTLMNVQHWSPQQLTQTHSALVIYHAGLAVIDHWLR